MSTIEKVSKMKEVNESLQQLSDALGSTIRIHLCFEVDPDDPDPHPNSFVDEDRRWVQVSKEYTPHEEAVTHH